jgi:CheY-like chemotaxis protein
MAKKVLIVEDYDDSRNLMQLLVKALGYDVLVAVNGNEAVEITKQEVPDLILMDIALPEMDGLNATEIIRNSAGISKIPIVAVSAFGKILVDEAIKAGCDDVITKPVDFDSLEPVLNQYLEE